MTVQARFLSQLLGDKPGRLDPVDDDADDPARLGESPRVLRRLAPYGRTTARAVLAVALDRVLRCELLSREAPGQHRGLGRVVILVAELVHDLTGRDLPGRGRQLDALPAIRQPGSGRRPVPGGDRLEGASERPGQMHLVEQEQDIVGQQASMDRAHA